MRYHWIPARIRTGIGLVLVLVLAGALFAFAGADRSARIAAPSEARLESTIFSYDGQDFVRTHTTLVTEDGKSAVNTKLDDQSAAYRALTEKHSYAGSSVVFGRKYDANYAPLIDADGRLTGALFVAVPKD